MCLLRIDREERKQLQGMFQFVFCSPLKIPHLECTTAATFTQEATDFGQLPRIAFFEVLPTFCVFPSILRWLINITLLLLLCSFQFVVDSIFKVLFIPTQETYDSSFYYTNRKLILFLFSHPSTYRSHPKDDDKKRGGLTLARYQELYAHYLGNNDENNPGVTLFGPLSN